MNAVSIASKVSKNFDTFKAALAFQEGIKVAAGLFPPDENIKIILGDIIPLTPDGYTVTITKERDFGYE